MTSPNGNIFGVTGSMWGDFLSQRALMRSFGNCLICVWTHGWTNNRDAGDLRRHRVHYEVAVIVLLSWTNKLWNCRLCEIDTLIDYFNRILSLCKRWFTEWFSAFRQKQPYESIVTKISDVLWRHWDLSLVLRSDAVASRLFNGSAAFIWKLRCHWWRG